ncbi:hypothetical protein M3Y99_00826600 [Aphelenchoides fujianensis]|nr:hypothetical protein M3Y99_00826600 [Aphelenchoides fujianensis]
MRLSILIASFLLLAVAAATHRLPLFRQTSFVTSKQIPSSRHNSKFSSLLTGARNDPAKSDGSGFTVQVQIGTPAQLFDAQVSLNSAELLLCGPLR